jgi:hypothetical protein
MPIGADTEKDILNKIEGKLGDQAETAPSTDTARSGINGRLQRIAQRLSSLITSFPTSLGQKTMANSLPVVIASNQTTFPVTPDATENHLGQVGGHTTIVSSTITMSTAGIYATGDYMGTSTTPQSFSNAVRVSAGSGVIKSLVISDKITNTNVDMELWLLTTTYTAPSDNAAWAISDAEALTVQAIIPISSSGWYASSNNQVYIDNTLAIPIDLSSGTSLFYGLVARGTTPSFTSGDLTINLGILQD